MFTVTSNPNYRSVMQSFLRETGVIWVTAKVETASAVEPEVICEVYRHRHPQALTEVIDGVIFGSEDNARKELNSKCRCGLSSFSCTCTCCWRS
uniref:Uncharacterized protein n=1 Tax=Hyaloperonospora arabidopsidis (strain Emoy2) TaxID=559515 RepID=M4B4J8_HYAAE